MTTFTWSVAQLDRETSTGGVTCVHWTLTAQDGDYSAYGYGAANLTPDPSLPSFKPYEKLTEANALAWVWGIEDKAATEQRLAAQIETAKNPPVASGKPWE